MFEYQDGAQAPRRSRVRAFLRGVTQNLRGGGRAAFFARPGSDGFAVSWSQLAALIGLSIALLLAVQIVQIGLNGSFNPNGLPSALFSIPLVLLTAWAVTSLGGRADQTLALMLVILSAALWINALVWLLGWGVVQFGPRASWTAWLRWGLYYLAPLWLALAAAVAGMRMFELPLARRGVAVLAALAFIALPLSTVWLDRGLWTAPYDESAAESRALYDALAREDAYYLQPKLLERELAGLLPRRAGRANLYLIGVAGYADQDVFMREVNAVDELFGQRFGTHGHSIRLINNRKTVLDVPIASNTALARAIKRVGAVMDHDQDVLFLFLTSHGSRDQKFSMQIYPLQLAALTPTEIRRMLDDAGIKYRVVVVSACYSGGFVESLKDDNSLVITASAADRSSFGCSNEADFTYFGKAYFDEALRGTDSFIEAFDVAVPKIAAREEQEGFDPSNPQISVGANIAVKLDGLRRDAQADSTATAPSRAVRTADDPYMQFASLWISAELGESYYAECRRMMGPSSPENVVKREPGYFGGIRPGTPLWPRIIAAWMRYADAYCEPMRDTDPMRHAYADGYRRALSARDLATVSTFLDTPVGKRFVEAERAVGLQANHDLWRRNAAASEKATAEYQSAMAAIGAAFDRGRSDTKSP
jgi:hypothetical protein